MEFKVGIFQEEIPYQFVQMLVTGFWDTISAILEVVSVKYSQTDPQFQEHFLKCLDTIHNWNTQLKFDEVQHLKKKYPHIQYVYEYTYFRALKEAAKLYNIKPDITYQIPTLSEFLHLFYIRALNETRIRNLDFLHYTQEQFMNMFVTIIRQALFDCIQQITNLQQPSNYLSTELPLTEANLQRHTQEHDNTLQSDLQFDIDNNLYPDINDNDIHVVESSPIILENKNLDNYR